MCSEEKKFEGVPKREEDIKTILDLLTLESLFLVPGPEEGKDSLALEVWLSKNDISQKITRVFCETPQKAFQCCLKIKEKGVIPIFWHEEIEEEKFFSSGKIFPLFSLDFYKVFFVGGVSPHGGEVIKEAYDLYVDISM